MTSWYDPGYCDATANTASTSCVLWQVPWEFLLIASVVFFFAFMAHWIAQLLLGLLRVVVMKYYKEYAAHLSNPDLRLWTTWLIRTGLFWGGYVLLHLPGNWTAVLDHLVPIPFIVCLFFFTNAFYSVITAAARQYYHPRDNASEAEIRRSNTKVVAYTEGLRVLKYLTFMLLVIVGLIIEQVDILAFLKDSTLLGLILVFSMQPWLRNVVGGLVVFADEKFVLGNRIRIAGLEGTVERIELRNTTIVRDGDRSICIIPNSRMMEQPVANCSLRRYRVLELRVRTDPNAPVDALRRLIRELESVLPTLHPDVVDSRAGGRGDPRAEAELRMGGNGTDDGDGSNGGGEGRESSSNLDQAKVTMSGDTSEMHNRRRKSAGDLEGGRRRSSNLEMRANHSQPMNNGGGASFMTGIKSGSGGKHGSTEENVLMKARRDVLVALDDVSELLIRVRLSMMDDDALERLKGEFLLAVGAAMRKCGVEPASRRTTWAGMEEEEDEEEDDPLVTNPPLQDSLTQTFQDTDGVVMTTAFFFS